jgi:pyrimidine deaminase RibD-like protein
LNALGLQIGDLAILNVVVEGVRSVGGTHVDSVGAREVDGVDVAELCALNRAQVKSLGGVIVEGLKPLSHQAVRSVVACRCNIREVSGIQDHDSVEEVGLTTIARAGGIDLD